MKLLVANIGSTSFKYRLLDMPAEQPIAQGRVERIGQPGSPCPDYDSAIHRCLAEIGDPSTLGAVGFKAVHAGPLSGAHLVDDCVLKAMEEFSFHAPAHNPPYIAAIRAFRKALPNLPLVVLFETAFFDSMDEAATTYAVPLRWRDELGVRRYGFHGASHRAASERVRELLNRPGLRHISCHLGGSSSLAAIRGGIAVDTSFGMSPQSGLPQNNRTGDIDAFAVLYVMKRLELGVDEMARILANDSGLAGISGSSGDVRDLAIGRSRRRPPRAACDRRLRTIRPPLPRRLPGGTGRRRRPDLLRRHRRKQRRHSTSRLRGTSPSSASNWTSIATRPLRGEGKISTDTARTTVLVIPADEERIVARATAELVES